MKPNKKKNINNSVKQLFTPKTTKHDDTLEDMYAETNKWYSELTSDPADAKPVTEQTLIELKDEAKKCHDSEVANYNIKNSKTNSNFQWVKTVMAKGTVNDKVAAHIVAIQDNPVCCLETIRSLVNMVKVSKKKECTAVIDNVTELFLSDLLVPDQKLRSFHQRPLSLLNELSSGNAVTRRKLLSTWYFEDQLKEVYASYVVALNSVSHDVIDNNKEKSLSAMAKLLAGNPEQEKNLLSHIVNKLGDPSQKVASKAIYNLSQLLFKHPNMQGVVLNEVEKLLFRPNISTKAQYYSLCFLSQFYLSHEASEVARRLIEVYFSFFKACIKKGEVDSRMMSALLMGVNRAYPYAKLELDKISGHIDTIYRVVHIANFNIGLHALTLLYQVSDYANSISDRFYSALYKKLADHKLFSTTHQAMLLSLIYKALLKDPELGRVKVFVKRLLQLALFMQPSFACGVLYLISQLMGKRENLQALILKQSTLNVVDDDDNDDEEKYHDVKDEEPCEDNKDNGEEEEEVKPDLDALSDTLKKPSWYHCENSDNKKSTSYNPLNRNPLYAGGDFCAYTELANLKKHFHPSVALFATNIIEGTVIKYSGDPIKDFALIRFLDRFVFKNPKKADDQVQGAHPTFGKRKLYQPKGVKSLPVNSAGFVNEDSENIPVDELFMHTYLQKKFRERETEERDDEDLESVQSDEFEELDFMNEIGDSLKKKKDKNKQSSDDEESDHDDLDDDLDMNEDDKELLGDLDDDDDGEEDLVFDGESEDDDEIGNKKKKSDDISSLFASAEEFASLLEDEGSSKIAPGGSNTFANKDKADLKQIDWEAKRNRWLNGFDRALGKGKKRSNPNKFGNKNKKNKK